MAKTDEASEPDKKKVRFNADATPSSANMDGKRPPLPARDVVELRFVQTAADYKAGGASAEHPPELTTRAPFLHQIIPDEQVHGCQHCTVAVYIHLASLTYYIESDVEAYSPRQAISMTKANGDQSDEAEEETDVQALLTPFIKAGLTYSRAQFLSAVNTPFQLPLSNEISRYEKDGEQFAIYKERLFDFDGTGGAVKRDAFHDFHRRMAFLMFVHIDGASFIDDEDSRWEVFVTAKLHKDQPNSFVGYATVYPFAVLQRKEDMVAFVDRIRISQVAIVPLCQRKRHGFHLLDAIYKDAHKRNAMEVTVEDPSRPFRIVRDITDLRWAYRSKVLPEDAPIAYEEEEQLINTIRTSLLLTLAQARRCLEVHQFRFVDLEDQQQYKVLRLWVKRRLFKENLEEMQQFDVAERKEKLAQLYEGYEGEFITSARRVDSLVKSGKAEGKKI